MPNKELKEKLTKLAEKHADRLFPDCKGCVNIWERLFVIESGTACDPCTRRIHPSDNYGVEVGDPQAETG